MGAFGEAKRGLWVRSLYTGQNGSFGFHFFKVYPINLDGNGHKNLSLNKFVIFLIKNSNRGLMMGDKVLIFVQKLK